MSFLALLLVFQAETPIASIKLDAATAVVGKPIKGVLTLTLPEGQHGYQNPPADKYENPIALSVKDVGFKLSKVVYPSGAEIKMEGAEKPTKVYEGTIAIPFTLVAAKPSPKGMATHIKFKVDYQLCTMSSCFPPNSLVVKAPLRVVPAPKAKKP